MQPLAVNQETSLSKWRQWLSQHAMAVACCAATGVTPPWPVLPTRRVAYAPPEVRPGVLPRMLAELLATRVMVKGALRRTPASDRVLQRVLNARQFGIKMISNVTYGYTSAGFSGRMPMAELADSIVQVGLWCAVMWCGCALAMHMPLQALAMHMPLQAPRVLRSIVCAPQTKQANTDTVL
jgi:hypothetical protein